MSPSSRLLIYSSAVSLFLYRPNIAFFISKTSFEHFQDHFCISMVVYFCSDPFKNFHFVLILFVTICCIYCLPFLVFIFLKIFNNCALYLRFGITQFMRWYLFSVPFLLKLGDIDNDKGVRWLLWESLLFQGVHSLLKQPCSELLCVALRQGVFTSLNVSPVK